MRSSPWNYDSVEAYEEPDMAHFRPHDVFSRVLETWKGLWWTNAEPLWNPGKPQQTRLEAISTMNYFIILLHDSRSNASYTSKVAAQAAEYFSSLSENGFREVSTVNEKYRTM